MRKLAAQQGMTLIELMVSMVIGMFLVLGAVTVYTQGRQNYQTNESVARLQENLRFAQDVLEPDIRLGGYWGMNNRGSYVDVTGIDIECDGNDVNAWALATNNGITAFNNIQAADAGEVMDDCDAFGTGVVTDTDIIVVRRVSGTAVPLQAGRVQVQSGLNQGHLVTDGNMHADYAAFTVGDTTNTHDLVINAWYVAQDSDSMAGVPSLRRRTLVGTDLVDEEVIAGVENMQVQFGIDTDASGGDGSIDQYVDAEDAALAGNNVLAVRLWLLIRAVDEERSFTEGRADASWVGYQPLDAALAPIKPTDQFRRFQASKTIFLRNFQRVQLGS